MRKKVKILGKNIPIWLLATVLLCLIGIVVAGVIVSNILHLATEVEYPLPPLPVETPIELTYAGWPSSVTVGDTYTFTIRTRNVDPNYEVNNLITYIEISAEGYFDPSKISIDGVISEGEWDDATTISITEDMGTVKAIATPDYLFVLFDISDNTDARLGQNIHGSDQISININPTDGADWGLPCDIIFQFGADPSAWGGESSGEIDGWETQWVIEGEQQQSLPEDLELKTTYTEEGRKIVECKIPLASIRPAPGDLLKLGGAIDVGDGNSYVYPEGLNWSAADTYADVNVFGAPLTPEMVYVYEKFYPTGSPDNILWEGEAEFTVQNGKLIQTIGPWNAPVGYDVTCEVTFKIKLGTGAPAGTWHLKVWVEQ